MQRLSGFFDINIQTIDFLDNTIDRYGSREIFIYKFNLNNSLSGILMELNNCFDDYKKKKFKLKYGRIIFLLLLVVSVVLVSKNYTGAVVYDNTGLAASFGDHKITLEELNQKYDPLSDYYQALNITKEDVLNRMIEEFLLIDAAHAAKFVVTEDELIKVLQTIKDELAMNDSEFGNYLIEQGLKLEQFLVSLKNKLLIDSFLEKTLFSNFSISELDLKDYYDTNFKFFVQPERVKAKHILIVPEDGKEDEALARITELQERVEAGEDFTELARKYSEEPNAVNGGELGIFGRYGMDENFTKVAFSTPVGQVSGPVLTKFGYHIILVEDKFPEEVARFDEIKEQLKSAIEGEKRNQIFLIYITQLKAQSNVEIYLEE